MALDIAVVSTEQAEKLFVEPVKIKRPKTAVEEAVEQVVAFLAVNEGKTMTAYIGDVVNWNGAGLSGMKAQLSTRFIRCDVNAASVMVARVMTHAERETKLAARIANREKARAKTQRNRKARAAELAAESAESAGS